MKTNIFYVAFVGLMMMITVSACSIDSPIDELQQKQSNTTGTAIRFEPLTGRTETRAAATTTANITNFMLQGFVDEAETDSGYYNAGTTRLFDRVVVSRTSNNTWEYTPVRYWPEAGEVNFYAYSPALSPNVGSGFADQTPTITYTVPAETANRTMEQEDLLVARRTNVAGTGTVALRFQHALSRVVFNARSQTPGVDFVVTGVSLENLYSTGTLGFGTQAAARALHQTDGIQYDAYYKEAVAKDIILWENPTTLVDYDLDMGGSKPLAAYGDTYTPLHSLTNALMVMPQTTTLGMHNNDYDAAFYVRLTVETSDGQPVDDIVLSVEDVHGDGGPIVFEPGRQYTFNINITAALDKISFSVVVSDWDTTAPTLANDQPDDDVLTPLEIGDFWPRGATATTAKGIVMGVGTGDDAGQYIIVGVGQTTDTPYNIYNTYYDNGDYETWIEYIDDKNGNGSVQSYQGTGSFNSLSTTGGMMGTYILDASGDLNRKGSEQQIFKDWICALSGVTGPDDPADRAVFYKDLLGDGGNVYWMVGVNSGENDIDEFTGYNANSGLGAVNAVTLWYFAVYETSYVSAFPALTSAGG
jgi:hypothetical protein